MAKPRGFTILIATDGSEQGTAAVHATANFPWPVRARVHGVVVRSQPIASEAPESVLADIERSQIGVATGARKILARRWPNAEVRLVDGQTVDAIVACAERVGARVIVLGSRGHGPIARLLVGSTSLGVLRHMSHAALVVRGRVRRVTRVVLGFDGSRSARHATALLSALEVPRGVQVTIVRVLEEARLPSLALLPASARQAIAAQAAAANAAERNKATRETRAAAAELRGAGFKVEIVLRTGAPLDELLAATKRARAQLLVLGARGHSRVERLLLGSVAEGALHRSPVSVLVVR
jgi:nucleotide-binding universal stress UspA family protein